MVMRSPCGFGQLEQVVDGTNHRPFASDLVEPTQQKLPEPPGLLNLSEHRFDNLFAQPVATAPAGALELRRHGSLARSLRPSSRTGRMLLTMAGSSRSDVGGDATASEMLEVLFVAVASVCRKLFGVGAQHRANIGKQAGQSAGVCRTRLQMLGDDDLMGRRRPRSERCSRQPLPWNAAAECG